ncbi:PaaI family thioesterase [Blastomonas fulva]|jgi:uncharacterized protein (TIGR00369 family)|uniref:PaaI family thioesterase n=1 Tax=Blastomonas fulva TaxID=1550728 RepID=UPI0026D4FFCD
MNDDPTPEAADLNDGFDPGMFQTMMSTHGHSGHLGILYSAHGDNWVELALPYAPGLVGDVDSGVIASGPIISLMDNATSLSVWTAIGKFRPQVTLDLRVDYMRPATPGKTVIGRGECYKTTRSMAFVRGIAHDGDPDDPVAHVAGTFIRVENFLA